MKYRKISLSCLLLCWGCSIGLGQTGYPNTQYQGFGNNYQSSDWATSSPVVPDPGPSVSDHSSMSPDAWSTPLTRWDAAKKLSSDSTPTVPQLGSESKGSEPPSDKKFQSVMSAPNYETVPQPNSSRYPLGGSPVQSNQPVPNASNFQAVDNWYDSNTNIRHPGSNFEANAFETRTPNYRPDLGHRTASQTYRHGGSFDDGQEFDFENKKKQYPPMSEIFATGRYFGSASALYMKGAFQGNTAITTQGPAVGESIPFDFDYEVAPGFRLGFESKYGPGIELNYWQYDETSNNASFTSDGTTSGTSSSWMLGPSRWSRLSTSAAGERLDATHSIDVEVIGASFFKEIKFKISRINGMFGFQYATITQTMDSILSNGGGELGRLSSRTDLHAWGPKFGFEYYRPVGHTKLELITTVGGSLLFGQRDQVISNTISGDFNRVGADEFVTAIDIMAGVQYKKMIAENRAYFARLGFIYQTWIGGGTAVDPQDDFGLHGFSFAVGYNR